MLQPDRPVASDTREPQRGGGTPFVSFIGVLLVLVVSWTYLLWMDWGMRHMSEAADMLLMPRMVDWSATDLVLVFLMWAFMMAAMMLPSAFPSIRLYARVRGNPAGFVTGYLLAWFGFAALATLGQWRLLEAALVTPMMRSASTPLSAGLLIAAGLFQLTPLKDACLTRCRSPLGVLLAGYAHRSGALGEGFRNGMYCVGCCFALMGILFVVGVMNLPCVFVTAAYVAIEKMAPRTALLSHGMGALLCVWGVFLIVAGWGK